MPPAKKFVFVCGQDDFLVDRLGRERFDRMAADTVDEFSREVISGFVANTEEVESCLNRFREAVQTIPMFGGKHVVWLKDVNFLAETQTGKARNHPEPGRGAAGSAGQVRRRRDCGADHGGAGGPAQGFPQVVREERGLCAGRGQADGSPEALASIAEAEARALGASFAPGAAELLVARVGTTTRLLVEEVRKLASYAAPDGKGPVVINEAHVAELTPNTAEGDFFETAEAFCRGDLTWTLAALQRHFFTGGDARPVLAALQNRNRLMIQVRALIDAGAAHVGQRGVEGLAGAAATYRDRFGEAAAEKSSYNVFSQNPWYLGKLLGGAKPPSLRRLIDTQGELIAAFEEINRRPQEQEEVLREMAVRCLAG